MTNIRLNIIFFLFFLISVFSNIFSQEKDTIKLKKLFQTASSLEETYPDSSINYYEKIISITKSTPNQKFVALTYNRLASVYYESKGDLKKRFDLNFKALKIFEAIHDTAGIAQSSENIGISLVEQRRYFEAIYYHKIALNYSKKFNLTSVLISSTMSLADCFSSLSKIDSAIFYMKDLELHFPKEASNSSLALFYSNLGNTYYNLGENTKNKSYFKNAIFYAEKSKELCVKFNLEQQDLAFSYGLIGASNMALANFEEAKNNYLKAIKLYEANHFNYELTQLYFESTLLFIKMGNKELAQSYFFKNDSLSKLIYSEENIHSVSAMKTQFETEKKESQNKLLQTQNNLSNKTIKQQRVITYIIIVGFLIVSSLAFFIFSGLKKQRKANQIISQQKILVEQKHQEITDSINYAERIQRSFLATKEQLDACLKEYFVFFKPKDVVSGDFYWAHTLHNGNFILVTADSTGHGVPGAIMSILNISSLEKAVEFGQIEPSNILNHTRQTIINRLKKDGSIDGGKDGMDCSLISFNSTRTKLDYSAANNPIWIVRSDKSVNDHHTKSMIELLSDKMPVGKHNHDAVPFSQHSIELHEGDMIYTLTDGFPDQFGGPKGKKFMYKKLKEILISISDKPLHQQQLFLNDCLIDWMGKTEQVDDITIIGIRV